MILKYSTWFTWSTYMLMEDMEASKEEWVNSENHWDDWMIGIAYDPHISSFES